MQKVSLHKSPKGTTAKMACLIQPEYNIDLIHTCPKIMIDFGAKNLD